MIKITFEPNNPAKVDLQIKQLPFIPALTRWYISEGYAEVYEPGDAIPVLGSVDPVEQLRQTAYEMLYEKRKEVEYGGFEYAGMRWASTIKDELRLNSAYSLIKDKLVEDIPGYVVNPDNVITLTGDIVTGAAMALMTHYNTVFNVWAEKKEELSKKRAESTITKFIENEINTGWPEYEV